MKTNTSSLMDGKYYTEHDKKRPASSSNGMLTGTLNTKVHKNNLFTKREMSSKVNKKLETLHLTVGAWRSSP